MNIYYIYHSQTGEFLSTGNAKPDPRVPGRYLYPAFSTPVPPPEKNEGQVCLWREGEWTVVDDHRGVYYDTITQDKHDITDPGVIPGNHLTREAPENPYQVWMDNHWEVPLEVLKKQYLERIKMEADGWLREFRNKYSETEQATWTIQTKGAEELSDNEEASSEEAAFVRELANARHQPLGELIESILLRATIYKLESERVLLQEKALQINVETAASKEELEQIPIVFERISETLL